MAMTIIDLDGASKTDFSVLIGKNILLKFTQRTPLVDRHQSLRRLINTKDLLLDTKKLDAVAEVVKATGSIHMHLATSIRRRDTFQDLTGGDEAMINIYKVRFERGKDAIAKESKRIGQIEGNLHLYLAQSHELYFCEKCSAYLGPMDESLASLCQACDHPTNPKPGKRGSSFRFLTDEMHNYLGGMWIQDYAARLLRRGGWRTWTECMVMGASGVNHQIDLLAVHEQKGRVVIGECKTQAVSDNAFQLITQFSDIQPSFGLLISLNPMNNCDGKSLIERKPGLKLIELLGKSDEEATAAMNSYVSGDN